MSEPMTDNWHFSFILKRKGWQSERQVTDGILDSQDPEDGLTLHPSMPSVIPCLLYCPKGLTGSKPGMPWMQCEGKLEKRAEVEKTTTEN